LQQEFREEPGAQTTGTLTVRQGFMPTVSLRNRSSNLSSFGPGR